MGRRPERRSSPVHGQCDQEPDKMKHADRAEAYTMYILYRIFVMPEYLENRSPLSAYATFYKEEADKDNIKRNMREIVRRLVL